MARGFFAGLNKLPGRGTTSVGAMRFWEGVVPAILDWVMEMVQMGTARDMG